MVNYKNVKVYKIVCNITGEIYVGSTCSTLSQRLAEQRDLYKCDLKGKGRPYSSFQILKRGDYNIVLLEKCPSESKEELLMKERECFDKLDCVN